METLGGFKMNESTHFVPKPLVSGNGPPTTALGRWLLSGGVLTQHGVSKTRPWYLVLCLTGVDYFSTLGYQPGIALIAAGALSPIATAILVFVTLFCALPVYSQVASRSFAGQGSVAMIEELLSGWGSKFVVLVLLGFVTTDFVITMTLSAADAAQHAVENPFMHPYVGDSRLILTLGLLLLLSIVFLKGFSEAIGIAAVVTVPFLILNGIVIWRGVMEIISHPDALPQWKSALFQIHPNWTGLAIASAIIFPKLALGLSGFETGVSVMPLVSGERSDNQQQVPLGRIAATRKLLTAAAIIMSLMLIGSSFVTTLLIPPEAYQTGGPASGRAIAYLAHHYLGNEFGTIYDISTIVTLWFAGASAMAGLLQLIPRYLPRFGMAPRWVSYRRPLVLFLFVVSTIVTLVFNAEVEAQGGAYATGVLVLILSASVAVALSLWREIKTPQGPVSRSLWRKCIYFWIISAVFLYTLIDNIIERPDGVIISGIFIVCVIVLSAFSRWRRSVELRVEEFDFADSSSEAIWQGLVGKKIHLVPTIGNTPADRMRKEETLNRYYKLSGPKAFFHVSLLDNRSEFLSKLCIHVRREGENYVIVASGAIAIANTIAFISEQIDPIDIFLGLTRKNMMTQAFRYLIWGEGETALMVYTILLRYWQWTPEEDVRPYIFLMSD
jgi:hypothetical protein